MTDLKQYVDELFLHQHLTPEVEDLKEEILSNMTAKRDDLIAQGFEESAATEKAKESLSSIEELIDGSQLTYVGRYRGECLQSALLGCIIFWIFSMPMLFFRSYAVFCYMGFLLTVIFGAIYLVRGRVESSRVAFLSIEASERRKKVVWIVWGLFFIIYSGTMAILTFGSNVWFGRPLQITGPYQMANIAIRFYLPLLTIIIPITISNFTKLLVKNSRREYEDA